MALSPDIAERVLATARLNAAEVAQAFSRALDAAIEVDPEKIETFSYIGPPPEWNGPGLAIVLTVGSEAALLLLAASSGLVPSWCKSPDATGASKLATLAQELGATLLPDGYAPTEYAGRYVENLTQTATRAAIAMSAGAVHCVLKSGDKSTAVRMVWPASQPKAIFSESSPEAHAPVASHVPSPEESHLDPDEQLEERLRNLPTYVRSLLRISLPVSVVLATIKQPVRRILDIGPGSIIQFEKSCEQPLTMCVGNQPVAEGEAVKVGEKFGIKLTAIIMPGERFFALRGKRKIEARGEPRS